MFNFDIKKLLKFQEMSNLFFLKKIMQIPYNKLNIYKIAINNQSNPTNYII